jgi:uncharacterized protein (AIM24 family)
VFFLATRRFIAFELGLQFSTAFVPGAKAAVTIGGSLFDPSRFGTGCVALVTGAQ